MQRFIPILAFALVVGACATAPTESAPDAGAVATTVAGTPGSDTTVGSGATSAPATAATGGAPAATTAPTAGAVTTDFQGEAAPDFRLALADGSDFVLSEEAKPVFMIFWAEW